MEALQELITDIALVYDDIALLAVRAMLGFIFITAAKNKFQDIKAFAEDNDLPVLVANGLATVEFLAGLSVLFGILPILGALAMMAIMVGSIYFHIFKWGSPYWASEDGWEYDLMVLVMASIIVGVGGGEFSLLTLPVVS